MQEQVAATAEELNELRTRIGDAETNSQRLQRIEDKRVGELTKRLSEQEVGSLLRVASLGLMGSPPDRLTQSGAAL